MKTYQDFRKAGYGAREAKRAADICKKWANVCGSEVRLRARPEEESYFSLYGEPDGYVDGNGKRVSAEQEHEEICESIERDGCWRVISEFFDGEKWQFADSVGMCVGYGNVLDPVQNSYIPDLMQAAMEQREQCVESMAEAV